MTSIRRWLLGWLIFGMAAASMIAAFAIFHTARREASELFDYELRTVALSLPSALSGAGSRERREPDLGDLADDRIVIEIWDRGGTLVYRSARAPVFERLPPGFHTVPRGEYHWRIFGVAQTDRATCRSRNRSRCAKNSRCSSRCTRCGRSACCCR
ncbi:hypothetical protein OKW36_005642 [Paraburkholderia sp. MM5482-R1]